MTPCSNGIRVDMADGSTTEVSAVHLATGHETPAVPPAFIGIAGERRFVADPWQPDRLSGVDQSGSVLILGTGLTMVDVATTLLRERPRTQLVAVSRRGLRPREQGVLPPAAERLARMAASPPEFVRRHGVPDRVLDLLRAVRGDIARGAARGEGWERSFDDLRDAAPILWSGLSAAERRRALSRLRAFYDVHRFRVAPQLASILAGAERQGRLVALRGSIANVARCADGFVVDCDTSGGIAERLAVRSIVNCTGPSTVLSASPNPLVSALLRRGLIRADATGSGIEVTPDLFAVDRTGAAVLRLRVFGPLTRGTFGDLIAVPQINSQIVSNVVNSQAAE
jgi:uncharacterized NAD(P)/FAD-binding protein YdhS